MKLIHFLEMKVVEIIENFSDLEDKLLKGENRIIGRRAPDGTCLCRKLRSLIQIISVRMITRSKG